MNNLSIDCQVVAEKISGFLKDEFQKKNKSRAILAISGGIDSVIAAFLCKRAGLDLYGIALPYHGKGGDGKEIAKFLNLPEDHIIEIDIAPIVQITTSQLNKVVQLDHIDKGNIMARTRMIIQYALARKLGGLVIGTENLSEYYLGYFTLFGDQACDISPISGLWKTQVYQLAEYLGVPEWVLKRAPSAGLWEGQTDEAEFGFTYKDADQILNLAKLCNVPKEKIISDYGFDPETIGRVFDRVEATEYKRQETPKCV